MTYKNETKTLLVLDIDETLIFGSAEKLDEPFDFRVFNYFIYQRPYLKEFFEKIKDHFLIALWSSADDEYVEEIAKKIIPKNIELEFIWARSRCSYKRNFNAVFDDYQDYYAFDISHYHFLKPLKKLKKKGYKLERILIVDDTPHKSKDNYGNAIYPKEYKGDKNDNELLLLADYLLTLKDKTNVRRIEKRGWKSKLG
ncbi:TFIIF-interacting CTD phosphatase [Bernardetia litoralis DSM 6794]|uniref:TFIIF-interacting CTD phosphatase n=1 Tax=Bernardetia litoralis (strain ATCC 23117 / DSM 6794 / NBRC 15988 / NCIMB 1366 / Fx l1 / Sio-4) TaxID=880071 RepID=I4AMI9_BERLS|nr:HAD family hydrolase [Bernardetia litoralis]AFM05174.1 TFIIF-interacting CTD phosphatase [Bernardetia litoralis DSM 6794]